MTEGIIQKVFHVHRYAKCVAPSHILKECHCINCEILNLLEQALIAEINKFTCPQCEVGNVNNYHVIRKIDLIGDNQK